MTGNETQSSIRQSVAQNVSVMLGAQLVTWGSSFLLLYFMPRYLGPEDFGRLYLALSVKMMLGLLIDFGGNYMITKEVARSESVGAKIFSSYIMLRILLWILSLGLVLLASHILGYSRHVHLLILILLVAKFWESGITAISAYFQGIEKMGYPSVGTIIERVFVAIVAVAVLLLGADSIGIAVVMTVGAMVNLAVMYVYSRKLLRAKFSFDTHIFILLRPAMPFFLFSLFSVIYYRIDAVMLASLTTEEVTGWYGGAFRFFDIVMVLPLLYKTAIFPVFSRLWDDKGGLLENTVTQSLRLIIILGMPTAIVLFLFARNIIGLFMGLEAYGPSVMVLKIFALSIPIIYIDIILGSALMGAANRQRSWAIVGFAAIFLNVFANFMLIPYFQSGFSNGGIGAAIATLLTELFVMLLAFYLLPREYLRSFQASYLVKPITAALMMVPVVLSLRYLMPAHWLISLAAGGLIYLTTLFLLRSFTQEEMHIMRGYARQVMAFLPHHKPPAP